MKLLTATISTYYIIIIILINLSLQIKSTPPITRGSDLLKMITNKQKNDNLIYRKPTEDNEQAATNGNTGSNTASSNSDNDLYVNQPTQPPASASNNEESEGELDNMIPGFTVLPPDETNPNPLVSTQSAASAVSQPLPTSTIPTPVIGTPPITAPIINTTNTTEKVKPPPSLPLASVIVNTYPTKPEFNIGGHPQREIFTIILLILVAIGLIVLMGFKTAFDQYIDPILSRKVYSVMKEVILSIGVISIVLWIDMLLNLHGKLNVNIAGICTGLLIFSLVWFLVACVIILAAQSFRNTWVGYENKIQKKDEILERYKLLTNKYKDTEATPKELNEFSKLRYQVSYFITRQYFIGPTYHPILTESFLRDDFDFAHYLTLCLEKYLTRVLNINLWSFLWFIICFFMWFAIKLIDQIYMEYALFLIMFLWFVGYLTVFRYKFKSIQSQLILQPEDCMDVTFPKNQIKRDPYINAEMPSPPYLQDSMDTNTGVSSNRHEKLFLLNSPKLCPLVFQFLLIANIFFCEVYISEYFDKNNAFSIVTFSLILPLAFANCVFIAVLMKNYCVISNIEMKKDQAVIEEVVLSQKVESRELFAKLYRLLKSSLREDDTEFMTAPRMKEYMIKLIRESFVITGGEGDDRIDIKNIRTVAQLLGNKLQDDELIYLARDSTSDMETITLDEFLKAIELLANDVKLDPYLASREALLQYIGIKERENTFVTVKELKELLDSFGILDELDVNNLLHEAKYISWNENEINVDHLAGQIRNNIEGLAR